MKINIVPSLIALIASALLALLFYTLSESKEEMLMTLMISGFLSIFVCLECGIGISFKDYKYTVNSLAISFFFLVVFIAEHCCFAAWGTSQAWLIITTGLLLVLYLLIYYGISKAKM